jgi:hypothetical protein
MRSEIKMNDITDGASNTFMLGEKYDMPDHYFDGSINFDDQSLFVGFDNDNYRSTNLQCMEDTPGYSFADEASFGSAHANGFFMAFCDGSVQMINYSIDQTVYHCLGNRHDGQAIDGKAY